MFQPTTSMAICGIMVCPVQDSTLWIPLIFTMEFDLIPFSESIDPGSQINIVCYQQ